MNKVGIQISKAIKEGKWLSISYVNKNSENTFYWIAVQDINIESQSFCVTMFNEKKSLNTYETWISFNSIKTAEVIEFSSYDVPEGLIEKIEKIYTSANGSDMIILIIIF